MSGVHWLNVHVQMKFFLCLVRNWASQVFPIGKQTFFLRLDRRFDQSQFVQTGPDFAQLSFFRWHHERRYFRSGMEWIGVSLAAKSD